MESRSRDIAWRFYFSGIGRGWSVGLAMAFGACFAAALRSGGSDDGFYFLLVPYALLFGYVSAVFYRMRRRRDPRLQDLLVTPIPARSYARPIFAMFGVLVLSILILFGILIWQYYVSFLPRPVYFHRFVPLLHEIAIVISAMLAIFATSHYGPRSLLTCIALFIVCVVISEFAIMITESHLTYTKRYPGLDPDDRYILRSLTTYLHALTSAIMLSVAILRLRHLHHHYDTYLREQS